MDSLTVHAFAKWRVREGYLDVVLNLLYEAIEQSLAEEGNASYEVYQDGANPNILVLFESYLNKEALIAHRNSKHFQNIIIAQIIPYLENHEEARATLLR